MSNLQVDLRLLEKVRPSNNEALGLDLREDLLSVADSSKIRDNSSFDSEDESTTADCLFKSLNVANYSQVNHWRCSTKFSFE